MKLCATLLIAIAAAGLTVVSAGAKTRPAPASVVVRACTVGDTPRERSATFHGRMSAGGAPGTARMSMRFALKDVVDGETRDVSTRALRKWRHSRPGVRAFGYAQKVAGLQTGGSYNAVVRYRWHGASGRVLREETRRSGQCRQRGDLPNLAVGAVKARRATLGTQVYSVKVTNSGRAAARDVATEIFLDGAAPDEQVIALLEPGESRTLRFTGPTCRRRLRAVVDSHDAIHETTDDDNVVAGRCPPL